MTGSATKAIAAQGQRTDVSVTLKRTVAKIAVQTSATAEFSQRYQGKIRINTAVLSKAASRSNLIAQQAPNTGPMTFTHTQAASETSGKFDNLFYGFGERESHFGQQGVADAQGHPTGTGILPRNPIRRK